MSKLYIILLCYFVASFSEIKAQKSTFKIIGTVADSLTKQALPFGYVSLIKNENDIISTVETKLDGQYTFNKIPSGTYLLKISYVGYISQEKKVEIKNTDHTVPKVNLLLENIKLNEVTVKTTKPLITQELGKISVNVEGSILANNGNSIDILRNAPFVRIDDKMNISLKGKKVTILLDGRLINVSGESLEAVLSGIPSQTIEKIELVSNPGAKYEASGLAVINIKTTKMKTFGTTGVFTAGIGSGTYPRYNTGLQLYNRKEKLNIYGGITAQHTERYFKTNNQRTLTLDNSNYLNLDDFEHDIRATNSLNLKLGTDFIINPKTNLNFLIQSDLAQRDRTVNYQSNIGRESNKIDSSLAINSFGIATYGNVLGNINFNHKIGTKKAEISADSDFGRYFINWTEESKNDFLRIKDNFNQTIYVRTPWDRKIDFQAFRLIYKQPFKLGNFESGIQYRQTNALTNFTFDSKIDNNWLSDADKVSSFSYKEKVSAVYFNFDGKINKLTYQVGLRSETTSINGLEKTNVTTTKQHYTNLFPAYTLQYSPSENNQFSTSYSRKIIRHGYEWQSSKLLYKSLFFYSRGNPTLQPALANSLELVYTYKQFLTFNLSYTTTANNISALPMREGNNTIYQIGNVPKADIYSFDVALNKQIMPKWQTSTGIQLLKMKTFINATDLSSIGGYSYYFHTQNYFTLGNIGKLDVSATYQPRDYSGVFIIQPVYSIDLGFSKSILNKKGDLRLIITDVFNTNTARYTFNGNSVNMFEAYKVESRFIRLNFTYRFGNKNVKMKDRKTGVEQEIKRAN